MLTDLHTWGVLPLALPVADANQVRSGQAGNPDSSWCTPNGVDLFIANAWSFEKNQIHWDTLLSEQNCPNSCITWPKFLCEATMEA